MTDYKHIAAKWPATTQGFRTGLGEAEQDNLRQHDTLTLATSRLQAWQDWTARILTPEVQEETASLSTLIAESDRDPHVPYRAAVLGAFATLQAEVAAAKQAADSLENLARHNIAEVLHLRRAIEAMLLAAEHTDPREAVIEAAAKVGAYLDYGTHDNPDTRVMWRLDDRKDGAP